MNRNKMFFAASLILTLFVLSSLLEDGNQDRSPSMRSIPSKASSSCPDMGDFMMNNPDATSEEMYEIEQCSRDLAKQTGRDQPNTGFLGNTPTHPKGALAHYEMDYGRSAFTVFGDRIEVNDSLDLDKTITIPLSKVTAIKEDWEMPSALVIEYDNERGNPQAYSLMLLRDDDAIKAEGARDIDRLIALLKTQKSKVQ